MNKEKKKPIETDASIDVDTQRQKERIRLNEAERKKRENGGDTNRSESKENNKNYARRLANKTPGKESDNLGPLKVDKKRKQKYKKYLADDLLGKIKSFFFLKDKKYLYFDQKIVSFVVIYKS